MKHTHFFTYLTVLFLVCSLSSCRYEQVYTYTTINRTSVSIKLNAYDRNSNIPIKTISVDSGEEYTEEHIEKDPSETYDSYRYFNHPQFLEVIYNNEKKEIFINAYYLNYTMISPLDTLSAYIDTNRVSSIKNPLNTFFYDSFEVTFIFTEEDYENATPCEGDCE